MKPISIKRKKQILSVVLGFVILSCTFLAFSIQAQRADVRILDSAFITSEPDGQSNVEIQFTCGVRYKGHAPKSKGKELRIRIAPITCAANRGEETRHESIRPKTDNVASLLEILYEGVRINFLHFPIGSDRVRSTGDPVPTSGRLARDRLCLEGYGFPPRWASRSRPLARYQD